MTTTGTPYWQIIASGRRFIIQADDLLAGFLELEAGIAPHSRE